MATNGDKIYIYDLGSGSQSKDFASFQKKVKNVMGKMGEMGEKEQDQVSPDYARIEEIMKRYHETYRFVVRALDLAVELKEKEFKKVINMYFATVLNFLKMIEDAYPSELITREELKRGLDAIRDG